jgi:hypothetical protein
MGSCDIGVGKHRHGFLTRPRGQFHGHGLVFFFFPGRLGERYSIVVRISYTVLDIWSNDG